MCFRTHRSLFWTDDRSSHAQGIEAQTLANVYLAIDNELAIIPVLNKIDLPGLHISPYVCLKPLLQSVP